MKKLLSIYFSSMAALLIFAYILAITHSVSYESAFLPHTITVFFHETGETKEVELEQYLVCVISAEMPAEFEKEALCAQAVAARTYIYNKYKKFSENPTLAPDEHKNATICTDSTHCCAYYSKEKLEQIHGESWMDKYYEKLCKAVSSTRGKIITYEGEPIMAAFHASSGGCRTENSEDVWSSSLPYLRSVESKGEDKREGYNSTASLTCDEFKETILASFPDAVLDNDRSKWLGDISYTEGNSVKAITVGGVSVKGTQIRSMFGLKSSCFEISMLNDRITFSVHGSGHGVGLSQHGANLMAKEGYNYKEILTHYYTGVQISKI